MTRTMKNSGVEWIGEIPENWETVRTKNVATLSNGNSIKDDEKSQYEDSTDAIPYISTKDIDSLHNIDYCNGMYVKNDNPNFKVAHKNSILMCIEGGSAGIKKAKLKQDVCFVNKLCCFEPKSIDSDYLYYFLNSPKYEDHFKSLMSGLIGGVSISDLKNINCTLPPLSEQQKIAAFLDEKCGAIDEIISKTEQSIEEYKKLKQSVITKAVTKGIRSNRPMQDSNIEWIGEIPQNWSVIKLRYLYRCQNGISKSAEFFGKGFPFVSYKDVYNNDVLPETVSGLCDATEEELNRYSVKQGDIFFTRTSETIEEIGLTSICLNSFENATFAGFLIRCRPYTTKLDFEYSKYYMASSHLRLYFVKEMNLVTRASLSQELLKDLQVLIPPLEEQKEIAQYLDEKCAEIDTLIEKKQQFLAEIANYKKSLIYEYVTGKKEVA